jgi:hypothetical protein
MARDVRRRERRQAVLLPPDMQDRPPQDDIVPLLLDAVSLMELVAHEERGERRDFWGFRPAQVFACARFLSATGEKLANPRSC